MSLSPDVLESGSCKQLSRAPLVKFKVLFVPLYEIPFLTTDMIGAMEARMAALEVCPCKEYPAVPLNG
jgi:hypothetical protein